MTATITPGASFRDILSTLPPIDGIARLDLVGLDGSVRASIPNEPGKQGSLAVYHSILLTFGALDAAAARHGMDLFAEHTADARNRPGAHPNIDRLLDIAAGGDPLSIRVIPDPSAMAD